MGARGLVIGVLAAGGSTRMRGGDKVLEPVGGVALLRRVALQALALDLPVLVTMAPGRAARRAVLADLDVQIVEVADAAEGMAASFRALARAAGEARGLMSLLADMPELSEDDLRAVSRAWDGQAVVRGASAAGVAGQPVIFPRRLFGALGALRGDAGARSVLAGEQVTLVALPGQRAVLDLDTPEAWAAWRAGREDGGALS